MKIKNAAIPTMLLIWGFFGTGPGMAASVAGPTPTTTVELDGDSDPAPSKEQVACHDGTILQWCKEKLAKEPHAEVLGKIDTNEIKRTEREAVEVVLKEMPLADLARMGLPSIEEWKKISGGKEYMSFRTAVLGDRTLVIADAGDIVEGLEDFYLKVKKGYKRVLREKYPSDEIKLVKLGKDLPLFLSAEQVGGSGWSGQFYQWTPEGSLKEVLTIGGWGAQVEYADLEGKRTLAVLNYQWDMMMEDELGTRLEKCKGPGVFMGPQMTRVTVSCWNGKKFETYGTLFRQGDEW